MTAPFEPEEVEAVVLTVDNSHLVRASCVRCKAPALCDPTQISKALCTGCLGQGSAFAPGELPHSVPTGYPITYGRGEHESARERSQHPETEYAGEWSYPLFVVTGIEIPDPVHLLCRTAQASGWEVRIRYSRGNGQHATTGKPTALSHLLAVAVGRREGTGRQGVAVYVRPVSGGTWTWKTVYVWGPDLSPLKVNREDLDMFIEDPNGSEPYIMNRIFDRVKAAQDAKPCRKDCAKDHEHKRPAAKKKESGG